MEDYTLILDRFRRQREEKQNENQMRTLLNKQRCGGI